MARPPFETASSLVKMGKTARWFRGLLGGKKAVEAKEKRRWGFLRSSLHNSGELRTPPKLVATEEKNGDGDGGGGGADPSKQPLAVANSGSAAAQAAVNVVVTGGRREDLAAVKIQSVFRGCLAKRALRALKGLVKLQAMVRGYIVRKQALETLHCMHALVRVQARALACRTHPIENQLLNKTFSPVTPEKCERDRSETLERNSSKLESKDICNLDKLHRGGNLLDKWMDEWSCNHQRTSMEAGGTNDHKGKIPEKDPIKQKNINLNSSESNVYGFSATSKNSTAAQASILSLSSVGMQSSKPAGSGKTRPFTPSKSDCSQSFLGAYSSYPNYMAETKSSKAKVRSQSAPKQRPSLEKCCSERRLSVHGRGDVFCVGPQQSSQRSPLLFAKFGSKGYPGSGPLDSLGMPIEYSAVSDNRC